MIYILFKKIQDVWQKSNKTAKTILGTTKTPTELKLKNLLKICSIVNVKLEFSKKGGGGFAGYTAWLHWLHRPYCASCKKVSRFKENYLFMYIFFLVGPKYEGS